LKGGGGDGGKGLHIILLKQFGAAFDVSQDDNEIVFSFV
jgi:hypothetical protein